MSLIGKLLERIELPTIGRLNLTPFGKLWRIVVVCIVGGVCLVWAVRLAPAEFWHSMAIIGGIMLAVVSVCALVPLGMVGYGWKDDSRALLLIARFVMVVMPFGMILGFVISVGMMEQATVTLVAAPFGIAGVIAVPLLVGALWGALTYGSEDGPHPNQRHEILADDQ